MKRPNRSVLRRLPQSVYIFWSYLIKRGKPLLASYKLTYRCNLRCRQCPFYTMQNEETTYEQACRIIDRLYDRGNRLLMFEGGEPMLWRDGDYRVHDLVDYAAVGFLAWA